jgi:hypothetical protein
MQSRDWKNRMREIRSCGSVGEPVGNHRLYPAKTETQHIEQWSCLTARRLTKRWLLSSADNGAPSPGG